MTIREKQRTEATLKIADYLLAEGLARTGVRQLAAAAGISDRMLLYYFKSKDEVMLAALGSLAGRLTATLNDAIPQDAALMPGALFDIASELLDREDVRGFMTLWLEATAASVRNVSPYPMIAKAITDGFLGWMETRLKTRPGSSPSEDAAMLMGMLDGLEIVRICAGEDAYRNARNAMSVSLSQAVGDDS